MPPPQFQVHLSEAVKEQLRDVVARAGARGQREDALRAVRKILDGLTWIADELGESRYPLNVMGELRVVVIGPIGAVFAVDRAKLAVQSAGSGSSAFGTSDRPCLPHSRLIGMIPSIPISDRRRPCPRLPPAVDA